MEGIMAIRGQGPFFFPPNMGAPRGVNPQSQGWQSELAQRAGQGGGGGLAGKGGGIGTPGGQGLPTGAHQLVAHQNALAQATPEVHLERAKANTEAMKAAHTVLKAHTGMLDRAHKTKADGLANLTKYWMGQAPRGVDPTGYARSMVGQMQNYGRPMTAPRGVSQAGYNRELMQPRSRYSVGGWDSGHGAGGSFGGGYGGNFGPSGGGSWGGGGGGRMGYNAGGQPVPKGSPGDVSPAGWTPPNVGPGAPDQGTGGQDANGMGWDARGQPVPLGSAGDITQGTGWNPAWGDAPAVADFSGPGASTGANYMADVNNFAHQGWGGDWISQNLTGPFWTATEPTDPNTTGWGGGDFSSTD